VKKNLVLVFYWLIIPFFLFAQTETDTLPGIQDSLPPKVKPLAPQVKNDSPPVKKKTVKALPQKDSISPLADSVPAVIVIKAGDNPIYLFQEVLRNNLYYKFFGKPLQIVMQEKQVNGSEKFFYLLVILFFLLRIDPCHLFKISRRSFYTLFPRYPASTAVERTIITEPAPLLIIKHTVPRHG
jgi:hypothetical protein